MKKQQDYFKSKACREQIKSFYALIDMYANRKIIPDMQEVFSSAVAGFIEGSGNSLQEALHVYGVTAAIAVDYILKQRREIQALKTEKVITA